MFSIPQSTQRLTTNLLTNETIARSIINSKRFISSSISLHQARERIRPVQPDLPICRPCLGKENRYLPVSSLIGVNPSSVSIEEVHRYPIRIPRAAVDPKLLKSTALVKTTHQDTLNPEEVLKIREMGELKVKEIVEDWVRNELNVMGTIREKTIEKFMLLLLNPSTLAPLAMKLKLRTDGETKSKQASLHAPIRIVPAASLADIELSQLFYYFIGSLHLSLPNPSSNSISSPLLKNYLIGLLKTGLPHTSLSKLLIRSTELSGQSVIGIKKGHARAELRVASLSIWGERRCKKLKKLVPDQKNHRNALNLRKAELLKQRWKDEEEKMIHWRRRMLEVTAAHKADTEAERLSREDHAKEVTKWKLEKKKNKVVAIESTQSGFLSRFMDFWRKSKLT
ncbi:uncharacterized protein MELLADRAFT_72533 [Melampsora larici-populina 98AG31]|uniref:Uncharacterized protein n=1 Tax=Melampsora larici-populina (strain 98AG31 / pathotype 3-4-7) TaxID=747676 RepID=F4RV88_MELLP|nr:uncharacterized protein MELLADRAFT_72533 [Melampsora larici-populina 98AG31]EGG03581.1 hypothetical protein MELLADRAFT_72533 [Melampsora larici-populina 98AG31]